MIKEVRPMTEAEHCQSIAYEMVLPSRWQHDEDVPYVTTGRNVKSDTKRVTGDERVEM